jgi:hypothetical protein
MLCSRVLLLCCVVTTLVATALVCLHDVFLMCACCGKCSWSSGLTIQWIDHMTCVAFWAYKDNRHLDLTAMSY